jgi:hypothetical protein
VSVTRARRLVTHELKSQPAEVRDAVEMLVSELATNCVRHTDSAFSVAVEVTGDAVRVEVSDGAEGWPRMRFPTPSDADGRGLRIVDLLAQSWGIQNATSGAGKTVWFEVRVEPADQAAASS